MNTSSKLVLGLISVLALVVGIVAFTVLRTPQEASAPLEAIPLATSAASAPAPTALPAVSEPTAAAATDAPAAAAADATTAPAPTSAQTLQIVQGESEVRFVIDEVLNNAPKTVIGATNQIAGEIAVNPADPSQSQVGIILVNARSLATDNDFRNRAIKNSILATDQYELITFEPTSISGLPTAGVVGQPYSFQMVGNLTVRDVTREVTFDVTLTPMSETRLEGTATSIIRYADFGISIPRVPSVASVADEVRLELDFVAAG